MNLTELKTPTKPLTEEQQANWDAQLNEDIGAGKLDALFEQALQEFKAGTTEAI